MNLLYKNIIIKKLIERRNTLSIAESCTGGKVTSEITKIPGVSKILLSSIIAYSNQSKNKFLKIDKKILDKYGAVSKEIAKLMAKNILKINNSDFSISTTGIAGPSGGTSKKPVGLTFICIATRKKFYVYKFIFKGTRMSIQKQITEKVFKIFSSILK